MSNTYDNSEIITAIHEINMELNSSTHDIEKLRLITKKAKQRFMIETALYEFGCGLKSDSSISIDSAPIDTLMSRLPLYKTLYESELMK